MGRRRNRKPRRRRPAARPGGRAPAEKALGAAAALLVAFIVAALAWLVLVYPKREGQGGGREVAVELPAGASIDEVAFRLERAGVLASPRVFAFYMRLLGADEHLREGRVLLRDDMTVGEVARRIALGLGAAHVRVTIPEGFHRFDVAKRLAAYGVIDEDEFERATEDRALLEELEITGPSAEGYLFPDTYEFGDDATAEDVVRVMTRNFRQRVDELLRSHEGALTALSSDLEFGLHEVVILASVVEKEAAIDEERSIIAGVFLNRLRSTTFRPRRRLQADPTVSYGCLVTEAPSCAGFRGRISRAMLEDSANFYNTYRHGGLPPGPIANPGLASIRAVLAPSSHDYLYFVARGGGRHAFSASLEQHNAKVDRFIRRRRR